MICNKLVRLKNILLAVHYYIRVHHGLLIKSLLFNVETNKIKKQIFQIFKNIANEIKT
jgi:hypothetical protein